MDPDTHGSRQAAAAPPVPGTGRETPATSGNNSTRADSSSSSSPSSNASVADNADDTGAPSNPKVDDILAACKWRDVGRLRSLAEGKGGLLTDALRRQAWPLLLGLEVSSSNHCSSGDHDALASPGDHRVDWRDLPRHRDEDQVQLDVNRSFIYYPSNLSESELNQRKSELSALINEVLRRYPYLCYFQGYHDICQVFLLVLEPQWRARTLARLSVLRIRDFMLPSFAPTTSQLRLLPDIISNADPKLRRHLAGIEPFYALAGTLTMYAHNIEGYRDIARLFDVFLAREPVFSIYVFAQIVLDRREEIFEIDEPDMLHVILGKVPAKMDLDRLIADSSRLFENYPPETLPYWRQISSSSALKTARDVEECGKQTMEEGKVFFHRQVKDLQWAELCDRVKWTLWAYRRPARAIGVAVAVGALAFYLRRNPAIISRLIALFSR
ncbi:rab-GTPase-TBC domain-containing protein [Dactylonectria estremocensis]|uniref:Rab-GTPase-TBC domain-containing protein n=1 Tax=Dactylonectria estremocensis TaxID=1079267 RepID=A0A9P9EGN2_9HYPO|nr:rab-GTPase-TBC domain-containing protein [Dactylonectria estremocensis]